MIDRIITSMSKRIVFLILKKDIKERDQFLFEMYELKKLRRTLGNIKPAKNILHDPCTQCEGITCQHEF